MCVRRRPVEGKGGRCFQGRAAASTVSVGGRRREASVGAPTASPAVGRADAAERREAARAERTEELFGGPTELPSPPPLKSQGRTDTGQAEISLQLGETWGGSAADGKENQAPEERRRPREPGAEPRARATARRRRRRQESRRGRPGPGGKRRTPPSRRGASRRRARRPREVRLLRRLSSGSEERGRRGAARRFLGRVEAARGTMPERPGKTRRRGAVRTARRGRATRANGGAACPPAAWLRQQQRTRRHSAGCPSATSVLLHASNNQTPHGPH